MENDLFITLGKYNEIPQNNSYMFNNIFGVSTTTSPFLDIPNFREIYNYYRKGGFYTILISKVTEILSLIFGMGFLYFIFTLLDWQTLLQCDKQNVSNDCGEIHNYIKYDTPNVVVSSIIAIGACSSIYKICSFCKYYKDLKNVHNYYKNTLKISIKNLQTLNWYKIINEIEKDTGFSIYEITNIIMRKDNYYIALIKESVIKIRPCLYTKQLEFNLKYLILGDIKNISSKKLKMKFILFGILNLFASFFVFIYLITHFLASNIDQFYYNSKIIGVRKYLPYYKIKFKEYNELQHFFENRINNSIKHADEYLVQFPFKEMDIFAKFTTLITGSFVAFFILISFLDENVLLYVKFFNRSLIFYVWVIGLISAYSRSIITQEEKIYSPNTVMKKVAKYTRYMPSNWVGRCDTYDVRDEFTSVFQYSIVIFFYDLLSVIITPLLLIFIMPRQSSSISTFIKTNTIDDKKIGYICSLSSFKDEYKIDNKSSSYMLFCDNHTDFNNSDIL